MNIYKLKRKSLGLTQKEVARQLGIEISSLNAIESGYRSPGKLLMYQMSKLFNCHMEELVESEKKTTKITEKNLQQKYT